MKATWILVATMCGLMFGVGVADARALVQEPPTTAQSKTLASERLVWTGRTRQADGSWKAEAISPTLAKDLRKELARIQVAMDVERRIDDRLKELNLLAVQASRPGYAERKDVLIEIALVRASALIGRGDYDSSLAAVKALDWVFVHSVAGSDLSLLEFAPACPEDEKLADEAANDPRVVKLRAQFRSTAKIAPDTGEDKIATIVSEAVLDGNLHQTRDLGERAIPTLQQLAAKDLDTLPVSQFDPLRHLSDISPSTAAEFIRAHFDDGGALWKTRILRLMREGEVLKDGFGFDDKRPFMRTPEWRAVVERLIDDPMTTRESIPYAEWLTRFDMLSPSLQRSLVRLLCGADATMAKHVQQTFQEVSGRESLRPVFAGALASPHVEVRAYSAEELLRYESSPELLAAASHSDPAVRVAVATALSRHNVYRPDFRNGTTRGPEGFNPDIGENERALLTKLSADAAPEVRAATVNSIRRLSKPLADDVYVRLANDPDARVRAQLLSADLSEDVRVKLAMNLATDKDPNVLNSIDALIFEVLLPTQMPTEAKLRYLPVIDVRVRNTASAFPWRRGDVTKVFELFGMTSDGLQTLLKWSLEDLGPGATGALINLIRRHADPSGKGWPEFSIPIQTARDVGLPFTPAQFRKLFVKVARDAPPRLRQLTQPLATLKDELAAEFLPIASDPKQLLEVRAMALQVVACTAKESIVPLVLDVLHDPRWTANGTERESSTAISASANSLEPAGAAQVLEQVLTQKGFSTSARDAFVTGYVGSKALRVSDADRVLSLWSEGQFDIRQVIVAALTQVATRQREAQGDWLLRGLNSDIFYADTLQLIGESRDPSYLPVMKGMLASDCPLVMFKQDAVNSRLIVINALTRYFDDGAAAILLETAGSTSYPTLRDAAFSALETIRKYRTERGRWEELRTSKEATATAVKDLVSLLDDTNPAVRAQAARGLGTLHAIEQMPRLVRLLKDSDDSVRKAANDALSVLNAPTRQD